MNVSVLYTLALGIISLGLILTFIRLVRGPSLPDRVVAIDLAVALAIGIIACYAILFDQPAFLDVAIIIALISFLGTIAFAYYIERRV
ncbi:MAG: cation:proton antiporter [Chloroflexota bacterium]|jgi:multicomponent Na+:H+ antiporter subunit F